MPPKKQKAQKMALADFFAETTGTASWADEMESLPTAPAARDPNDGPRRGEAGYLDSMPDRGARSFGGAPQGREELPLPTVPPFTAFIGNLTFETEDAELRDFFSDIAPTSVRLVKDPGTGKSKGFGYVEFGSQADLKAALDRSGANLAGRGIRVNVAEAPSSRPGGRDFAPSVADESNSWRRATPLPAREAPHRTFSGVSANSGEDRDWSSARGAKFTPSSRESSGYGHAREHAPREHEAAHPSAADEAGQWRSSRPLVQPVADERRGPGGRDAPPHRPSGPADSESTWARGTRVPQSASPVAPQPQERQRLKLAPRSSAPSGQNSPEATPSKGSNPFGAARPVDTHTREVEAEQHAEQRRREAAAAATAAKEKAAAAKEKAAAAAAAKAASAKADSEARRPARVHPSRLPQKEAKEVPVADDDGFEAVGPRGGKSQPQQQEDKPAVKPATTKQGFSFAAAAGKVDVDVEDVADKVADVTV